MLNRRTIVFRLWLALSFIAIVISTGALGVYVWLSVSDDLNNAREQTQDRVQAVLAVRSRYGLPTAEDPQRDSTVAGSLGIELVEAFNTEGELRNSEVFGPAPPVGPELEPELLELALIGGTSRRTIRRDAISYTPESISALDVIRGGRFGEEHIIPLSRIYPSERGAVRIVASYRDMTQPARTLIARSVVAAEVIIAVLLVGMWYFLRHFVAAPLRRYSDLAMQIAVGERVRMPANGSDELSQLGRAVNGMADALEHQATVDSLTGLFNLRHLSSHLEALINEAKQEGKPLSVIYCDLDNLKGTNDTYGHEAGDRMLRAVAQAIQEWAAPRGTCWRLSAGGDEFVIALPDETGNEANLRAESLRKAVASVLLPVADSQIRPSISVGVASYPDDGDSPAIMGIADKRMYAHKIGRPDERHHSEERRLSSTPAA
jgi:diguanylate cyclase (GGDEF)-like protein